MTTRSFSKLFGIVFMSLAATSSLGGCAALEGLLGPSDECDPSAPPPEPTSRWSLIAESGKVAENSMDPDVPYTNVKLPDAYLQVEGASTEPSSDTNAPSWYSSLGVFTARELMDGFKVEYFDEDDAEGDDVICVEHVEFEACYFGADEGKTFECSSGGSSFTLSLESE